MRFHRSARTRRDKGVDPAPSSEEVELAEETDALVTGRLVDHLAARGRPIPPWAVLNRVGHLSFDELVDLAAGRTGRGRRNVAGTPFWAAAERRLAFQLLTHGWTVAGVHDAQIDILVPLELALIELADAEGLTAADALEMAGEMLTEYFVALDE
jgi:hypothetical protein